MISGCSTYDRATTDWRHPSPIWHPEPLDDEGSRVAVMRLPDAPYAGKHFDQLRLHGNDNANRQHVQQDGDQHKGDGSAAMRAHESFPAAYGHGLAAASKQALAVSRAAS